MSYERDLNWPPWESKTAYVTGGHSRELLMRAWPVRGGFDFAVCYQDTGHRQVFSVSKNDLYHMVELLRERGFDKCLFSLEGETK